ncbi:MAG: hypothetical protein LBF26_02210 [Puniceicoccales bacterium]|jgi:hypothetical protein|nr:hypothetical protein [Puniceicoccales bacterium]
MKILSKWFRAKVFGDFICRAALIGITFSGFYFTVLGLHNSFLRECQKVAHRQSLEIGALRRQIALLQRRTSGLLARVDAYENTLHFLTYSQKAGGERR